MKDEIFYRLLTVVMTIIGTMPRSMGKFAGDILGLIWFRLDRRHREITLENIRFAFGGRDESDGKNENLHDSRFVTPDQQRSLAKKIFKNIAGMVFELGWAYRLNREDLPSHFIVKGFENIKRAHEKGRGVLIILSHMGNWEFLVASIALTGYISSALYRKLDFEPLERLIREMREKYGTVMIPLRGASRLIDERLAAGELVGTLMDQNVDWYKGVITEFFGRPACTNSGVASLVLRTDTAVVPAYIVRDGLKHVMYFEPEIPVVRTGDRIKDIEINTQNYTSAIESVVRRYPEQWFWVHNRWKVKNYSLLPGADREKL